MVQPQVRMVLFTEKVQVAMRKHGDIVMDYTKKVIRCNVCGEEQPVKYPISLRLLIALCDAWEKAHKHCRKQ
jgi:hypothetical protein